jgi:hypothetical protein
MFPNHPRILPDPAERMAILRREDFFHRNTSSSPLAEPDFRLLMRTHDLCAIIAVEVAEGHVIAVILPGVVPPEHLAVVSQRLGDSGYGICQEGQ